MFSFLSSNRCQNIWIKCCTLVHLILLPVACWYRNEKEVAAPLFCENCDWNVKLYLQKYWDKVTKNMVRLFNNSEGHNLLETASGWRWPHKNWAHILVQRNFAIYSIWIRKHKKLKPGIFLTSSDISFSSSSSFS